MFIILFFHCINDTNNVWLQTKHYHIVPIQIIVHQTKEMYVHRTNQYLGKIMVLFSYLAMENVLNDKPHEGKKFNCRLIFLKQVYF